MKAVDEGQCLRHGLYGIGVATQSNEARTTIDFYEHGKKLFVTRLLEAELLDEAPPRPSKARAAARRKKKAETSKDEPAP